MSRETRRYRACTNAQGEAYLSTVRSALQRYVNVPATIPVDVVAHALIKPDDVEICRAASRFYGFRTARRVISVDVPFLTASNELVSQLFKFELRTGSLRLPEYVHNEFVVDRTNLYYGNFRECVDNQVAALLNVKSIYAEVRHVLAVWPANNARAVLPGFKELVPGTVTEYAPCNRLLLQWFDVYAAAKMMPEVQYYDPDESRPDAVMIICESVTE